MAPPIRVLQIVDDSPHSEYAFKWACDHILLPRKGGTAGEEDYELVIMCVSTPHPAPDYLVTDPSMFNFSADPVFLLGVDPFASAQLRQAEFDRAHQEAYNIARKYYDVGVANGLAERRMQIKVVNEIDGIGRAVKDYCDKETATFDLCVCGSRGMGSFKRFMSGIADSLGLGLGSVSDYCVHNLPFPVLVIKQPQDAAHVKHAAEAHVQLKSAAAESAGAAKAATTMAELRGEPKGQQQKEGGSAPLKVTTIPPAKEPQTPQHAHHS